MADFNYVDWTAREPATVTNMVKMSENDQHLKDLVTAMPQGILGWAKLGSDISMAGQAVGENSWNSVGNVDVTCTVGENRLIRVTYTCRSVTGRPNPGTGANAYGARIRVDGTSVFGAVRGYIEAGLRREFPPLIFTGTLTAGSHTFVAQHANVSGPVGALIFDGNASAPHLLIVEDMGAYVDNS